MTADPAADDVRTVAQPRTKINIFGMVFIWATGVFGTMTMSGEHQSNILFELYLNREIDFRY